MDIASRLSARGDSGVLIVRAVLAVALLLFCVVASSQEPGEHKSVTQKNKKAEQPKPAAQIEAPGVEKAIRESIKEASEKPDPHAADKADTDRKLVDYTAQLATYTKELSSFTLLLVFATAVLGAIGAWQGYLTWRSVNISERALTHLERPFLFIDLSQDVFKGMSVTMGGRVRYNFHTTITPVIYWFNNTGRTAAILTHHRQEIVPGIGNGPPEPVSPTEMEKYALPQGEVIHERRSFSVDYITAANDINNAFLIGFIRYADIFGGRHITGFCAKFDHASNRFVLEGDKRYNSTDDEV